MNEHALNEGLTFVWHELYIPNASAGIQFYVDALDFGTQEMPMGEMGTYTMLTKNGKAVAGVMPTNEGPAEGAPPHWAAYLSVDDVDARVEKCVSLGASVVVPAMDVPGVGRMSLISDPQGAHIWLFKDANM